MPSSTTIMTGLASAVAGLAAACAPLPDAPSGGAPTPAGWVDAARMSRAGAEPHNWFASGRDQDGTYFSPLTHINDANVERLGFAWDYALGTKRGLEATPIVVDGLMVFSGNWGRVYALDARTGEELWVFDPKVAEHAPLAARHACCDVVNRGVSVWEGKVYVASLDGRLFALDLATGEPVWVAETIPDIEGMAYTVTGGTYIAGDVVVVGSSGADFAARGYVAAYDLDTGELRWRTYVVPRDPDAGPQESLHLEAALESWSESTDWSFGGGGTAWDGMAYDPALDLLYVGTGNAAPYNRNRRSPGGGDNKHLASILALDPADGSLVWSFQTVPGDHWDYTATQKLILADLVIDSEERQVIMQAPKNGFFYVLDRATGELISAENYVFVNWTTGLDPNTGRPDPNPEVADYDDEPRLVFPGMQGGHNWHPMAYNPETGLVYIPAIEAGMVFVNLTERPIGEIHGMFSAAGLFVEDYAPEPLGPLFGALPDLAVLTDIAEAGEPPSSHSVLRAWDPVEQRLVWEQVHPSSFWDGGVMTTAGNLVFRGDAAGELSVLAADDGRLLHSIEVGSSIMAAPMTYAVDGEQYVAVLAGYGGGGGGVFPPGTAAFEYGNDGRLIVFRLDGGEAPMPAPFVDPPIPEPPAPFGAPDEVARGEILFTRHCMRCHLGGRGHTPDLAHSLTIADDASFRMIVLEGALELNGMARFDDVLSAHDAEAIRAHLVAAAHAAHASGSGR